MVRDLLNQALTQRGHKVLGVAPLSPLTVVSAARTFRPKLLITDFNMPDCQGDDLVRAIRDDPALGATPILVFTAHRDPDSMAVLTHLGIHGLVFKGISLQEILAKVEAILAR